MYFVHKNTMFITKDSNYATGSLATANFQVHNNNSFSPAEPVD